MNELKIKGYNMDEMTLNKYQALAARTINKDLNPDEVELHALLGMASEIGEIHGIYQKEYQGHAFDKAEVKKELGDLLWFIAEFASSLGWTLDEVASMNIAKLMKRYPDGFEEERSLNREDEE